jgi:guanosine-3',5'-bis(diphosphate) 3'-pyrophosphohydrolase
LRSRLIAEEVRGVLGRLIQSYNGVLDTLCESFFVDTPQCSGFLEDALIAELLGLLREQKRPEEDLQRTQLAYDFARRLHEGQYRKNQENYIVHPVSVALVLARIPVDTATIEAALLHDVLEDTPTTCEEMEALFGEEVVKLVTGVTKLGKFEFASKEDAHAENFRKMFLAMADDVRVIMLKLADRLHNMRTLCHMKPEKQIKTATETLEIFAPLANRMGMGKIRAELEDLSMKYLHPEEYGQIDAEITETRENREETIGNVIGRIENQLNTMGIEAQIYGRVKNYYSIYKKMCTREKSVHEIHDISAVRVLVNSERECYEALGVIHHAFTPMPGRFKDYIAMPKSNLYQSLHTTVIGPYGRPLEVQIRTHTMHRTAEYGIAAHWKYKETGGSELAGNANAATDEKKMAWLRQMVELKNDVTNAQEYVDSVKLDLFRDEVFVFTPKGKVVVLPKGATTVDFAYRIHTEVGHTCTGARINGRIVPLSHELRNGDIVDILTSKKSTPRLDWLAFVQTQSAKSRIRHWFKKHYRDTHEEQGKKLLEAELTRAVVDEAIKGGKILAIAHELNYSAIEDLFVAIGYGELPLARITHRLKREPVVPDHDPLLHSVSTRQAKKPAQNDIQGLKGMVYQNAKCCTPLPGEGIMGVVTRSRGVMVHRDDCNNLQSANPARLMTVQWEGQASSSYSIRLDVHVIDRVGVLKEILIKIADYNTNLGNTKVTLLNDGTAMVEITLEVENLRHLDRVRGAIAQIHDVISVRRQRSLGVKR